MVFVENCGKMSTFSPWKFLLFVIICMYVLLFESYFIILLYQ